MSLRIIFTIECCKEFENTAIIITHVFSGIRI